MATPRQMFLLLALCCGLALAGCTEAPSDDSSDTPSITQPSGTGQPTDTPQPTDTVQPGSLVGTWTVDETFDAPEQPYVAFVQDNSWSASDGCNRVQGTWDVEPDGALTTTMGPQTLVGCDGAALPSVVSLAATVTVDGDTLTLYGADSSVSTILVRSTDSSVGPQGFPIGYWTEQMTPTSPFLSIRVDRSYSGMDACGQISGTWEPAEETDTVALTPDPRNTADCTDDEGWLGQATLARVRTGVMTLSSTDGTVLGQLSAA